MYYFSSNPISSHAIVASDSRKMEFPTVAVGDPETAIPSGVGPFGFPYVATIREKCTKINMCEFVVLYGYIHSAKNKKVFELTVFIWGTPQITVYTLNLKC